MTRSGRSPAEAIGYPFQYSWAFLVVQIVRNNARDLASIPGSGRSPGGGHDNPLQYSCLENPGGHRSLAGYSLENPGGHRSLAGYSPWGCRVGHD